ncbi:MAG: response regulator [Candidatus Eisenbacteria sp.]|nr:response regulator [Candidatus Eisenbacteria bacterium]
MPDRILFVDDDENILTSFRRQLRKQYQVTTAASGRAGLEAVRDAGPFAVVVSDLRMPGMDGIQFLSEVRESHSDSVRIMLTGNADLETAIEAINEGCIFRFLTKPCPTEVLTKVLNLGIEQYRLVTAERELLEKTLSGSIKVLTEILALVNPEAFGRSSRIKRYARRIGQHLGVPDLWRLETAAMLSQIGCVILPERALQKLYRGGDLAGEEAELFRKHPALASDLLSHIPRMEEVAEIVACQEERFDCTQSRQDSGRGERIPLGARVLKVVLDFDMLEATGITRDKALARLRGRSGWYDPEALTALESVVGVEAESRKIRGVSIWELTPGMILAEEVRTGSDMLLMTRGQEVSQALIERIKGFAGRSGIREPILVQMPEMEEAETPAAT